MEKTGRIDFNYRQCNRFIEEITKHFAFDAVSKLLINDYFNFIRPIGFSTYFTYLSQKK